jgi:hypothetical protein
MLWVYVMAGGISTSGLRCLEDYIGNSVRVTLGEQNPNINCPPLWRSRAHYRQGVRIR